MSNRIFKHASVFAVAFAVLLSAYAHAQPTRFDCQEDVLLEEGACVLSLFEIEVVVSSSGSGSINNLSIRLVDADTSAIDEVDGVVYRAEIADINGDGRPEVFAYVSSAGSGSYGSLVAYVIGEGLELHPITLPDLGQAGDVSEGYMGHDEFAVVETSLVRRFPLYHSGDVNAAPTGGTRNIAYSLKNTPDGWALVAGQVKDY
ncbi:MAG: PliI family lysozyme inhibitor of I-type lysozyme [Halioglobus sp.]